MKHRIATLAAAAVLLIGGATITSTALARDSFSVSIGAPGFALGYSNHGYGYGYVGAPPVYYAPPPVYYRPAPVYYGPPIVYSYGPYRSWYRHRPYYRHW